MMRAFLRAAFLALALGRPSDAVAQTNASLPPALEAAVTRIADSVRVRGLPTEPLFAKAAEGSLKGIDTPRILDAVRGLARELELARGALGATASTAELVAAASSLHAGLTPAQLSHVAQTAGDRGSSGRLVMPFVVLADLVARQHVSADVAISSIEPLVARGAPDAQFANLRSAVERDVARGERPDAATQSRSAAVLRTLEPRPPTRPPE